MSRIKRYQYIKGAPLPKDMHIDGGWIKGGADGFICKKFHNKIINEDMTIYVAFDRDMSEWNDYDNIQIVDDYDFQYSDFFDRWDEEIEDDPILQYVIEEYNDYMDSLPFLEPLDNMYKHYD